MKSLFKYLILIIVTVVASVCIYNYVKASVAVDTENYVLNTQDYVEKQILSNTNYTIDNPNVIVNPYGVSPLSAMVVFQTKDLAVATVTVKGKDGDEDITNTFLPSKVHLLPVYGLYPDYENTVVISSSDEEKTLKIKTEALPTDLKNGTKVSSDDSNKLYFTTSTDGYPVGYDCNGNVRWFLNKTYKWEFVRLSNGHILLGNDHLMSEPYYSLGLVEIDLLGKVYFEYNLPGGYHHDVFELRNGNFLVASNDFDNETVEDYIVEIDRSTGSVVKEIKLSKLLSGNNKTDWFGLNSVNYDMKSNSITISGSEQNMIINIDYASEEINWIIGDKVSDDLNKYLLKHDDDFTMPNKPQGLILNDSNKIAFVNTIDGKNYLTEYSIDTVKKIVTETKNVLLGDESEYVNVDYNDGVYIVNQDSKIKKVSDDSVNTIIDTKNNVYSALYDNIYAGDVYITGKGQRLGSIGVTKTIKNENILFWKNDKNIFDKYNLSLYKEANRLVVTGTFKKKDDVKLILDNVLDKKTYDVRISETPYFDSNKKGKKKINVSTYVNEEGLTGKFYIYLKVNGTTYKLNKYVIFY